jgi:hypothetical protein
MSSRVARELEPGMIQQVGNVGAASREDVLNAEDLVAAGAEPIAQVGTHQPGAASH